MDPSNLYGQVQDHYSSVARGQKLPSSNAIAQAFGYTIEELSSIPEDANLGLSCGNPLALAGLMEGETVVDLGSGAGFDIFLAAKRVGPKGRAIGVDMNKDMLTRACINHAKLGALENVSFIEGKITSIPIEDGKADCVISNCVINLVPKDEKPAVFKEIARILKPGGRVAISDILARKPFPKGLRESIMAYVGCVAGCSPQEDYKRFLFENGFRDIAIVDTRSDLNIYTTTEKGTEQESCNTSKCCGPSFMNSTSSQSGEEVPCHPKKVSNCSSDILSEENISTEGVKSTLTVTNEVPSLRSTPEAHNGVSSPWNLTDIDINEWAGSYKIFAIKI